jgi:hypothetical protein
MRKVSIVCIIMKVGCCPLEYRNLFGEIFFHFINIALR